MATENTAAPATSPATPPAQSQAPSQAPSDIQPNLNHILALLLDQAIPIEDILSELNLKAHQLAELVQTPRAVAATDSLLYLWNLRTDLLAAQARAEAMLTLIELSRPSRGHTPELTRRAAMAVIKHRPLCRGTGHETTTVAQASSLCETIPHPQQHQHLLLRAVVLALRPNHALPHPTTQTQMAPSSSLRETTRLPQTKHPPHLFKRGCRRSSPCARSTLQTPPPKHHAEHQSRPQPTHARSSPAVCAAPGPRRSIKNGPGGFV